MVFAGPPLAAGGDAGIGEEAEALVELVDEAILVVDGEAGVPAGLEEIRPELDRLRLAGIVATGPAEGGPEERDGR